MFVPRRLLIGSLAFFTPLVATAANPVTWNVSISTSGQDVFWTSPTAIDASLGSYNYSYEITKLSANVTLLGNQNLLGQLDETSGAGTAGAFPFEVLDEMLEEPTTGSSANIHIDVDSMGFGHASGTNIKLGTFLGLPIRRVDLTATVSILGVTNGDYDGDDDVDATDYAVWRADFGSTANLAADGNKNGAVDAADYSVWRNNMGAAATPASGSARVPEPSGVALFSISAALYACRRRPRRSQLTRISV